MAETFFVNDARVMSKGQVTIPKKVRAALGINTGDRVTFIIEGGTVRVVNSAVYALQRFQEQMKVMIDINIIISAGFVFPFYERTCNVLK